MFNELDDIEQEIYRRYKYALRYIGVDFSRPDIQEAILACNSGMEAAFQAVISYWLYKQKKGEKIYPSAALIESLKEQWQPFAWRDEYLNDPRFKSPGMIWWEEAGEIWGVDIRNQLVADVNETNQGDEFILFKNGKKISLAIARTRGWQWVLNYAQSATNYQPKPQNQLKHHHIF